MNPTTPNVPLACAEMLHILLETALLSQSLDSRTRRNIKLISAKYEALRDESLAQQGFTRSQQRDFIRAAAMALADWFEDQEKDVGTVDMSEFERMMADGDDSDQGAE
jgi:hypothetical protein